MCEFELNNVRIPKIRASRSSGTGTTWIGTDTDPVLMSGTSTYQGNCPEMEDFAIFTSLFFNTSLQLHPASKPTIESTQNLSMNTCNGGLELLITKP